MLDGYFPNDIGGYSHSHDHGHQLQSSCGMTSVAGSGNCGVFWTFGPFRVWVPLMQGTDSGKGDSSCKDG